MDEAWMTELGQCYNLVQQAEKLIVVVPEHRNTNDTKAGELEIIRDVFW